MILKIYTDGGSKGNPGPAAIGVVFYKNEVEILAYREDIGIATNNVAEYTAVIRAYELMQQNTSNIMHAVSQIKFYSDSLLLVSQLNGIYKVKNGTIVGFVMKIRNLEQVMGVQITYQHVAREKNTRADALVNNK